MNFHEIEVRASNGCMHPRGETKGRVFTLAKSKETAGAVLNVEGSGGMWTAAPRCKVGQVHAGEKAGKGRKSPVIEEDLAEN